MPIWSLNYLQSVFKHYHSEKPLSEFTYKMATKVNWHRYGTKLRHCHPMYSISYRIVLTLERVVRDYANYWIVRVGHFRTSDVNKSTRVKAKKSETCTYVRCSLIAYTKAFDTNNRSILFKKTKSLSVPTETERWIFHFFTGHRQAVLSGGGQSQWLPIARSIVQGSGIGPSVYLVY